MHIQKRKYIVEVSEAAIRHITIWTHELLLLEEEFAVFKDYRTQDLFTFSI